MWTLAAAAVLGVLAVFVGLTGGIDARVGGIPIRSRSWERPAVLAAILALAGGFVLRARIAGVVKDGTTAAASLARRRWRLVPIAAMAWTAVAAVAFGTFAAGGADSYGYVSQAELLADLRLTQPVSVDPALSWPDLPGSLTPLAFTRGPDRMTIAPVYPPGLSLVMAPFAAVHSGAVFLVVPICAVLAVFLCYRLGADLGMPGAGALASVLLAASPTFLYQAVQPMSDVPVTACWAGALVLARRPGSWAPAKAGAVASLAILIRPNLAPLAVFVAAAAATAGEKVDLRRAIACGVAVVPGVALLAAIQDVRYGSPLASGYGPFRDLFSFEHIGPNLERYPRWLTETHTPFIWLWVLGPLAFRRAPRPVRAFGWIGWTFCAAVFAAYLPYVYFRREEWSYTRFLLPALPLMLLFASAVLRGALRRLGARAGFAASVVAFSALLVFLLVKSDAGGVFGLRGAERKYPEAGTYVRDRLPRASYVFAMQHSGSLRYYSGRQTIRWDLLDRAWLDRVIASLRGAGYEAYAVLDAGEDDAFRERFRITAQQSVERLVPIAAIGPTRIYAFR